MLTLLFLFKYSWKIVCNKMLYLIFSVWLRTGSYPAISIGFKTILDTLVFDQKNRDKVLQNEACFLIAKILQKSVCPSILNAWFVVIILQHINICKKKVYQFRLVIVFFKLQSTEGIILSSLLKMYINLSANVLSLYVSVKK